ncbi:uncharacterized protein BO95DRAFT_439099 [Aspergillus brunneoviolaceus CBS 621.78]|uniref:Uncharacterized protein n=1 Tax=Aspergillus brunneoviolaceus CBS 621.78 TaxID=1450534 RepID=A0ACD1GKW0_9EURO|nr:hypothetical protein BO95DRAFT_439099 [Aspergillus brunneoviolaceus CBS 621.78]RAH49887.1 hypothetical protein BO95DRAFT_439099 [Aspergillus brunneoviolaceus CBS 621.78]
MPRRRHEDEQALICEHLSKSTGASLGHSRRLPSKRIGETIRWRDLRIWMYSVSVLLIWHHIYEAMFRQAASMSQRI